MKVRTVFFLVFWVGLFVFSPSADAETRVLVVRAPATITLGDPFLLRIDSLVQFKKVVVGWDGQSLPLRLLQDKKQYRARLLLGSDVKSTAPGKKVLVVRAEKYGLTRSRRQEILVAKRQAPVQRLSLPENMVSLSQDVLNRHRREKKEVAEALRRYSGEQLWSCPFQRPAAGEISSIYGLKRLLNGRPRSPHRGIDLRTGNQAPVSACNAGRVALTADHFFAGRCVYIDHGLGVVSMYFHLSEVEVQEGDRVKKGELIGRTGSSGRATGPHLHFGLSLQGSLVDPVALFRPGCGSGF